MINLFKLWHMMTNNDRFRAGGAPVRFPAAGKGFGKLLGRLQVVPGLSIYQSINQSTNEPTNEWMNELISLCIDISIYLSIRYIYIYINIIICNDRYYTSFYVVSSCICICICICICTCTCICMYIYICAYIFLCYDIITHHIEVSWNGGTPKSSILVGFPL